MRKTPADETSSASVAKMRPFKGTNIIDFVQW
jgi:hypothetical protein